MLQETEHSSVRFTVVKLVSLIGSFLVVVLIIGTFSLSFSDPAHAQVSYEEYPDSQYADNGSQASGPASEEQYNSQDQYPVNNNGCTYYDEDGNVVGFDDGSASAQPPPDYEGSACLSPTSDVPESAEDGASEIDDSVNNGQAPIGGAEQTASAEPQNSDAGQPFSPPEVSQQQQAEVDENQPPTADSDRPLSPALEDGKNPPAVTAPAEDAGTQQPETIQPSEENSSQEKARGDNQSPPADNAPLFTPAPGRSHMDFETSSPNDSSTQPPGSNHGSPETAAGANSENIDPSNTKQQGTVAENSNTNSSGTDERNVKPTYSDDERDSISNDNSQHRSNEDNISRNGSDAANTSRNGSDAANYHDENNLPSDSANEEAANSDPAEDEDETKSPRQDEDRATRDSDPDVQRAVKEETSSQTDKDTADANSGANGSGESAKISQLPDTGGIRVLIIASMSVVAILLAARIIR